jgi:preprotein translocase subunit SecG
MYGFLLTLLILDGIFLVVIVLLQAGKGGGLAAMGGGAAAEGVFGGRQAANFLTRSTWIAGGVFMFLALVLAIVSSRGAQQPSSILEDVIPTPAEVSSPILPGGGAVDPAPTPAEGAAVDEPAAANP